MAMKPSLAHDRFLIIDNRVYHVSASIKDLGKKWFAVSLMEAQSADTIVTRLQADSYVYIRGQVCGVPTPESRDNLGLS